MKKAMISIMSALTGAAIGAGVSGKVIGDAVTKTKAMSDKHFALFLMMNQWVKVKQEGKNLAAYFENYGYKNICALVCRVNERRLCGLFPFIEC